MTKALALVADLDLGDDLPDELQVHLGDADAGVAPARPAIASVM